MSFLQAGLDVLTSYVSQKTNKILCQLGNVVGEVAEADNVEWWQHYGFASRPPKPTKGESATQTLSMQEGNGTHVFASRDMRSLPIYGNLDFGEACLFSVGDDGKGQARVIAKNDGSVNVYTTDDNTKDGKAVYFRVAPDGFSFVAPWGALKFDTTGFHVNHTSGAQISAGGIYGLPPPFDKPPLDKISSYVRMQAGVFNVNASTQSLGGEAGHDNLASTTFTSKALDALQAQINVIAAAVTALGANAALVTGGPAAVAPVSPAVSAGAAALKAAKELIPTTTVST